MEKSGNINNNPELDFERIRILFDNMLFGYLGVVTSVTMLYFAAARYSSPETALLWLLAVSIANIPRIIVSIQFARKINAQVITPDKIRSWEYYMTLCSVIAYLGFVSVIFLPYGENVIIGSVICAFVFICTATGGVLALSTSRAQIMIFLTLISLSIVCKMLLLQDALFTIVAIMYFLGYLQVLKLIDRQHRILIENIALKIENSQIALVDPLTKLWNRRRLDLHVNKLIPASIRSGVPFSLIILDIDHFKEFNDEKGHHAGDELLLKTAEILLECSRDEDLVVRYGGEEFVIILPQTNISQAEVITERIRTTFKEKTGITISAGLAEYNSQLNFEQLVQKADEALYTAKNNGRDRYVLATT